MEGDKITTDTTKTAALCLDMCEKHSHCKYGVCNPKSKSCALNSIVLTLTKNTDSILHARSYREFVRIADQQLESTAALHALHGRKYHVAPSDSVCVSLCKIHLTVTWLLILAVPLRFNFRHMCVFHMV